MVLGVAGVTALILADVLILKLATLASGALGTIITTDPSLIRMVLDADASLPAIPHLVSVPLPLDLPHQGPHLMNSVLLLSGLLVHLASAGIIIPSVTTTVLMGCTGSE